jgi:hypothetical protein
MKKLILGYLLLIASTLSAQVYTIDTEVLADYAWLTDCRFVIQKTSYLFIRGADPENWKTRLYRLDLLDYSYQDIVGARVKCYGEYGDDFLIAIPRDLALNPFLLNNSNFSRTDATELYDQIEAFGWASQRLYPYQNNQYFIQTAITTDFTEDEVSLIDISTNTSKPIEYSDKLSDISPDKLQLLFKTGAAMNTYNIESQEVSVNMPTGYGGWKEFYCGFLSNSLVYATADPRGDAWNVYNIGGMLVGQFKFRVPGTRIRRIAFSNDLTRAIAEIDPGRSSPGTAVLLDTTAFRDKLDELGYIFRSTNAVLNDSRVRVRENPNLEAQHLGYLNVDDEVEVLDRSGIKVQIGELNDWWYKIKRKSDGLEGWAYGPFLDLEEEQEDFSQAPPPKPASTGH